MPEQVSFVLATDAPGIGVAGQKITMAMTPDEVYDPTELPTYLAGYKPFGMRADEVSPAVMVDKDKGKRRDFSSDNTFRRVDVKGSIDGAVPQIDHASSLTDYAVVDRFLGAFVNDITALNESYSVRQAAMRRVQDALMLDRELDVWTLLTTLANWDANNRVTLAAGFEWDDGAGGHGVNSDPIFDIQSRMTASAQRVTGAWMNEEVGMVFLRHPSVRDQMRQMLGDSAASSIVASVGDAQQEESVDFKLPGLPRINIVSAKVKNETTGNLDYVLGDDVVLTSTPKGVPLDGQSTATSWTFRRRGASGVGYATREYRVEGRGPLGGTMIVVSQADIAHQTASNVGGLIKNTKA